MDIAFETLELRELCASAESCERKLGQDATRDLFALVSDLESCRCVAELELIHGILFEGDSLLVPIGAHFHAKFVNGSAGGGVSANEPINWSTVRRVKLVDIQE